MKKLALCALVFVGAVIGGILAAPASSFAACAVHSWSPGDVFRATDLNNSLTCLNNSLKGAGFTLITGADVATSTLTRLNLAAPLEVPAGIWANITACSVNGSCTAVETTGTLFVSRTGAGAYSVTILPPRPNSTYVVTVPSNDSISGCHAFSYGTGSFTIQCNAYAGGAATDAPFTIELFDDDTP